MIKNYFHITKPGITPEELLDLDKPYDVMVMEVYLYARANDVVIISQDNPRRHETGFACADPALPEWSIQIPSLTTTNISGFLLPWVLTANGRVRIADAITRGDLASLVYKDSLAD